MKKIIKEVLKKVRKPVPKPSRPHIKRDIKKDRLKKELYGIIAGSFKPQPDMQSMEGLPNCETKKLSNL